MYESHASYLVLHKDSSEYEQSSVTITDIKPIKKYDLYEEIALYILERYECKWFDEFIDEWKFLSTLRKKYNIDIHILKYKAEKTDV